MMRKAWFVWVLLTGCLSCFAQAVGPSSDVAQSSTLSYDSFFLEAMMQRQKDNKDAAFDLLQHCVKLNPKAAEAYYYLAQYYLLMKQDSLARQYYLKAAELEPDNTTFLETVAQSYISEQDY